MRRGKKIQCNCCGKTYDAETIQKPEFLRVEKQWGYFSNKDGIIESFDVCEQCYDKWLESFVVSPKKREATELL